MISIIIPTLNEEKVLEKLLKNLKEIKTLQYEIIVSDGKSTDKTVEIAKRYADKVVIYQKPKRQTIGQGRNMGAASAAGEYVVFLDADDYLPEPDKFFARALSNFQKDPRLVALSCGVRVFPEMETFGDVIGYRILTNWALFLQNNILKTGAGSGEFIMVKTAAFRQIAGFREELTVAEDQDLFHRLVKIGRTRTDPKLKIFHTGRRPHAIGWLRLLWQWQINFFALILFKRSAHKEWKQIR